MDAYFDCFAGISGDMTLAAFVDLGVPVDFLQDAIQRVLPKNDFSIIEESVRRNGIQARNVTVKERQGTRSRDYQDIRTLIEKSDIPEAVREMSLEIFSRIAAAEAKIHGCPIDRVHFHEVGGVDAIVDIVGTACCVDFLKLSTIMASPLPLGSGTVVCSHGRIPVPAPATLEILRGVPVIGSDSGHETVTPTGAAIISVLAQSFQAMPPFEIDRIGYGAGKRELTDTPNLLRIITGKVRKDAGLKDSGAILIVETCIDDMNPEIFGFVMEKLFEDGALDVYWIPVYMKKNRPGTMIQVLCRKSEQQQIINRLLTETTTSGVRWYESQRYALVRRRIEMETDYGKIQVKEITRPDGTRVAVPEYEVCRNIAREKNIPIQTVYRSIYREGRKA